MAKFKPSEVPASSTMEMERPSTGKKPDYDKSTPEAIIKERDHYKSERALYETQWQEIMELMVPRKADITVTNAPGQKRAINLYDNTAMQSAEILAGALHGLLTSPNEKFFGLLTGDESLDSNDRVMAWLEDSTNRMHNVLNNSNFQTEVHETYLDLVTIGTNVMTAFEDDEIVVRFSAKPIQNIALRENNKGMVDCVYIWWEWAVRTIAQEYGEDKLSDKMKEAMKQDDSQKFEIIQKIYPMYLNGRSDKLGFKYVSQHILTCEKKELKTGFFREFPVVAPRWSKIAGEKYGYSPGAKALPEAKTVNMMQETVIIGAQKTIDPPIMAPDDGVIFPLNTYPGGISFYRSIGGVNPPTIKPIFNDMRIDYGFQLMDGHRTRIREAFYVDQLQMGTGPQMTATEVVQRTQEKMRLLGPMLGRMQSEFLRPLIDRVFDIMLKRGMFLPAPPELRGRKLDVVYTSPIAKAQSLGEVRALQQLIAMVGPVGQVQPNVYDNFNFDTYARGAGKSLGVPQKYYNTEDQKNEIREQRAQAQQQAMQAQAQQMQSEQVKNLAPAMKKEA